MRETVKLWMLYSLLYLDQRNESLVPRNESLVPKHESLVPKYESLVPRYERLASWHCRKLLLNPLLPTVPSGAQKNVFRHLLCGSL